MGENLCNLQTTHAPYPTCCGLSGSMASKFVRGEHNLSPPEAPLDGTTATKCCWFIQHLVWLHSCPESVKNILLIFMLCQVSSLGHMKVIRL